MNRYSLELQIQAVRNRLTEKDNEYKKNKLKKRGERKRKYAFDVIVYEYPNTQEKLKRKTFPRCSQTRTHEKGQ